MTGNATELGFAVDGSNSADIRLMKPVQRKDLLKALSQAFST